MLPRFPRMKLVLVFLMIFFGTLLAAGLVALGEPQDDQALSGALSITWRAQQVAPVAVGTP